MPKSPSDNKIQPENVSVEEVPAIDWDNIAIAVPHDAKTDMIVAARRERLTLSEWGRKHLKAALDAAKLEEKAEERRSGVDRRSA